MSFIHSSGQLRSLETHTHTQLQFFQRARADPKMRRAEKGGEGEEEKKKVILS